ncbi:MAG: GNAT family N-acetyltransferase [Spirochaetia bacterium]
MSAHASPSPGTGAGGWPPADPEGRPVRFTTLEPRPRPDEYEPVLTGAAVRLEPMREAHVDALCRIGLDPEITRYTPVQVRSREQMAAWVREAVEGRTAGNAIPFVTVLSQAGSPETVVGSTRFMSIDPRNRRMEIGATWIGVRWQRTRVNTEAKYLMLHHAFEELRCLRVEFKTDSLNERSRAALLRIGAVQEGVFRSHVITAEGRIRHSVYFSITAEEWPSVRARLEGMLSGPA